MRGKPFLQLVAEDLTQNRGGDLSSTTVVFPNNRARLFFNEYLVDKSSHKPLWSPEYITIQQLFASQSNTRVEDRVRLVVLLYRVYREVLESDPDWDMEVESLDNFYFWGETLLDDFEDVDNDCVDASQLFRHMSELVQYCKGDLDFLSEEQQKVLKTFYANFSLENVSLQKERFIKLWDHLFEIYTKFRALLDSMGISYQGMRNRAVVERLKRDGFDGFDSEKYVFIGFNVLNKTEETLFSLFEKSGKALFYWDYDVYFIDNKSHEAGTFMRRNLEQFPNALDRDKFSLFNEKKSITFVSSATEAAQARFLDSQLTAFSEKGDLPSDSAVVLCNEGLLLPALHSIPSEHVEDLNVTMGLPFTQTPVYGLLKKLLEAQLYATEHKKGEFLYKAIEPLIKDPYILTAFPGVEDLHDEMVQNRVFYPRIDFLGRTDDLKVLFQRIETPLELTEWLLAVLRRVALVPNEVSPDKEKKSAAVYDDLYNESIFRAYTVISRFRTLQTTLFTDGKPELSLELPVLRKLIEKVLSALSVPFTGEPVKGLQVMGFLETRNLDFKNVVMLSVNDGVLPKTSSSPSFIPYNLRKGFGMTTIDHKNSLYAYYFYRLLQRAENVVLLYNTSADGAGRGQMSRFMMQLLAESGFDIEMKNIRSDIDVPVLTPLSAPKDEVMMRRIHELYNLRYLDTPSESNGAKKRLSPTAIGMLIDCPFQFCLKYIYELRTEETLDEEIDNSIFGSIFHGCAEFIYNEIKERCKRESDRYVNEDDLRLPPSKIEEIVDEQFRQIFFKGFKGEINYTGDQLLNRHSIVEYVKRMLAADRERVPFRVVACEERLSYRVDVPLENGESVEVELYGVADRVDEKEGKLYVIDYKTGGGEKDNVIEKGDIERLYVHKQDGKTRKKYILQTLLYSYMLQEQRGIPVVPRLMLLKRLRLPGGYGVFSDEKVDNLIEDVTPYYGSLLDGLRRLIANLFDERVDFSASMDDNVCGFCDFMQICSKRKKDSGF